MKQVTQQRLIIKEKFGKADFGRLLVNKAGGEETSKKGISGVKGAFARLAAALQEIRRL